MNSVSPHSNKIVLPFDDYLFRFDDQYSLGLWGKISSEEFSKCMQQINEEMNKLEAIASKCATTRSIVLSIVAIAFFLLPGALAVVLWNSPYAFHDEHDFSLQRYSTGFVLGVAGVCGVCFFGTAMHFSRVQQTVEAEGNSTIKSLLNSFNTTFCNSNGVNWRLVDSRMLEIDPTYVPQPKKPNTRKWLEIEVEYTRNIIDFQTPVILPMTEISNSYPAAYSDVNYF